MKQKILIFDDNEDFASSLGDTISAYDSRFCFDIQSDPYDVQKVNIDEYAFMICDYKLDGYKITGIDVLKKLLIKKSDLKYLILSAYLDPNDALSLDCPDVINKGKIDYSQLLEVINRNIPQEKSIDSGKKGISCTSNSLSCNLISKSKYVFYFLCVLAGISLFCYLFRNTQI